MAEFDLIERIRQCAGDLRSDVLLGIGDDAAILQIAGAKSLVVCCDTLNEGVHFMPGTDPLTVGHKSLAVNLSDLSAMGAEAAWFLLSISMPHADGQWLDAFLDGLIALAHSSGVSLVGGDTTTGSLSVTITALGTVESAGALQRCGASPGDAIIISGTPGLAALALLEISAGRQPTSRSRLALEMPQPRLELGRLLRGRASACIDVSDGLLADLGHILIASGMGAIIELDSLPVHPELERISLDERRGLILAGGDDYELCFTLPRQYLEWLDSLAAPAGVELTIIGHITAGAGVQCREVDGSEWSPPVVGYQHFAPRSGHSSK